MLKLLCGAKPAVVKAVLKGTSPDLLNALSECSLNILKGHVHLTATQKRQLSRHRQSLRAIAKKKTSGKKKKTDFTKGWFVRGALEAGFGVGRGSFGFWFGRVLDDGADKENDFG